ncbi:MAG: hypothetical protein AB8G15_08060 [Saprospiraceae bacterium]
MKYPATLFSIAGISNYPVSSTQESQVIERFNLGTLTAVVERSDTKNTFPLLLSNAHTLSATGKDLYTIPPSDQTQFLHFTHQALQRIGAITDISYLGNFPYTYPNNWEQSYYVDAQLSQATVTQEALARMNLLHQPQQKVQTLENLSAYDLPKGSNYYVHKVGYTTGYTVGKVIETHTSVFLKSATVCANVILIQGWNPSTKRKHIFAQRGDSGALIYNHKKNVIGQLWGISTTDPTLAYASHIRPVLAAVEARLIY